MKHKFLIIGPAWVGDMVMSQTLYQRLKQIYPDCIIDVIAPAWSEAILARMPEVNTAIHLPITHGELKLRQRYQLAKSLRQRCYTHAIVLPNSWKSALIPWWAKIPTRTGYRGEMRWGLLNDIRTLDKQRYPLMIEQFMALAQTTNKTHACKPRLIVSATDVDTALHKHHLNTHNKPILGLCPGAEYGPAKRWPAQHFATVAKEKLAQGWQIWIFGSAKEQPIATTIQQHCQQKCIDLTGKTNLAQAIDLLSLTDAVITNDSGLMHIASALQRPLIALYGSSSPAFTPPLSANAKILSLQLSCSPCFKRECPLGHFKCLTDLMPQRVLNTLNELLTTATPS